MDPMTTIKNEFTFKILLVKESDIKMYLNVFFLSLHSHIFVNFDTLLSEN